MNPAAESTRWMIGGFLMSFLGSSILLGSTTGFITVGLLPVAWIAFYTTLENIEDLLAPLVARWLAPRDPGKALVLVEVADVGLATVAVIALLALPALQLQVFVTYLILVSILPLVVDVAEELFAARVMELDPTAGRSFLAHLHSLIALVSLVIARPLGAVIGTQGYVLVLVVNAITSAVAIGLRAKAVRKLAGSAAVDSPGGTSPISKDASSPAIKETQAQGVRRIRFWVARLVKHREVSPVASLFLAMVSFMIGAYLLIWCAQAVDGIAPAVAVAIFSACSGAGSVLGPQVSRKASGSRHAYHFPIQLLLAYAATLAAGAVVTGVNWAMSPAGEIATFGLLLFVLALSTSALVTQLITRRAESDLGDDRPFVVGWGQSLAAVGALVGGWLGLVLGVASHPALGLGVAAAVALLLALLYKGVARSEERA